MKRKNALHRLWPVFLLAAVFSFYSVSETRADSSYWIGGAGGAGDWNWAANWTHGIPETGWWAIIGDDETGYNWSKTVYYTSTPTYASGEPYILGGVEITARSDTSGSPNTVEVHHSDGILTLDGGSSLTITAFDGGSAAYYLSDNGVLVKQGYEVKVATGLDSTGYFEQTGGTFQLNGAMYIGDGLFGSDSSNSVGSYYMSGGVIEGWTDSGNTYYGSITLGEWGAEGYFTQDGGSVTINELNLARQVGSYGKYELNDGSLSVLDSVTIGKAAFGEFIQSGGSHTANGEMILGDASGAFGAYGLYSGNLTLNGYSLYLATKIGNEGYGEFDQEGGTHTVNGNLYLGYMSSGEGRYSLSGDATSTLQVVRSTDPDQEAYTGYTVVGYDGKGFFAQDGGRHIAHGLAIGGGPYASDPAAEGTYELFSGDIEVAFENIGLQGKGWFNQYGGNNTVSEWLAVGASLGGEGFYYIDDGRLEATNGISVGDSGTGLFDQWGGTVETDQLYVGGRWLTSGGANGTYTLNDGTLTVHAEEIIGAFGDSTLGTFYHEGGTHSVTVGTGGNDYFIIGNWWGTTGAYNLSGDTSVLTVTGDEYVGCAGYGMFNQSGGTHNIDGNLIIGEISDPDPDTGTLAGSGTVNLYGGSLDVTGTVTVGLGGTGYFYQSGGTHDIADILVLGNQTSGSGTYRLSDDVAPATLTTRETVVGAFGTGAFTQTGGSHTTDTLVLGYNVGGNGTYDLSGGSLESDFQRIGLEGTGTFIQTGGTNTVTTMLVIGQEASASGRYEMLGGTLTAANINNNANGTFIAGAGTTTTVTNAFTNYGLVSGEGSIIGSLVNAGTLSPGNSPGTLIVQGDYTQDAGSTLFIELGGEAQGVTYDLLSITGNASLAGTLEVDLYGGYTPDVGDSFDILVTSWLTGEFDDLIGPAGWAWAVAYLDLDGNSFNDTVRLTANAVPIPPTLWLFTAAVAALMGLRRRVVG